MITHATSQAAHFLGYEIRAQHSDTKITRQRRAVNGAIGLFVPKTVIRQRCALYMSKGKPAQRGALLHGDDFTIVAKYQAEYAGLVQYYLLAQDVFRLGRLHWVMETSLLKTLAGKHRSTVNSIARKYGTTIEKPAGNSQALFGKRPTEKDPAKGTSPAAHFTPRVNPLWARNPPTRAVRYWMSLSRCLAVAASWSASHGCEVAQAVLHVRPDALDRVEVRGARQAAG